jgi:hypothetical protein
MNSIKYRISKSVTFLTLGWMALGTGLVPAQQSGGDSGVEIMTRGPVHEAFAGIVSFDPKPGIVVNVQPPKAIDEVPPEQRLKGNNVAWIPGYWAWDEDQNDFLWVSGIWRNLPPGRQWFPGYWGEMDGRYQWTSGYWEDEAAKEVAYLPEPPRSVEAGPNIQSPSNDQNWIPGSWIWRDGRYVWRAGYWTPVRENWIWTPSYYRWTPHGYVYVDGYWDYAVARRGVMFAPVHFDRDVYSRPDFYYSPYTVISLALFAEHLFLRPSYDHYYFGDYYGPEYRDRGYFSSVSYHSSRRGYDPIYAYDRWQNRRDPNWETSRLGRFEYLHDHADARPPRTYAALASLTPPAPARGASMALAVPLNQYASRGGNGRQSFQIVGPKDRTRIVSQTQQVQKIVKERQQLETPLVAAGAGVVAEPSRVKITRSPIVAKQSSRPGKRGAPPARLEASSLEQTRTASKGQKAAPLKPPTTETPRVQPTTPSESNDIPKKVAPPANRKAEPSPNPKRAAQTSDRVPTEARGQSESIPSRTTVPEKKRQQDARPATETKATPKAAERQNVPSATRQAEPIPPKKAEPRQPAASPKVRQEKKQTPEVQQPQARRVEAVPQKQQVQPQQQRQQVQPQQQQPVQRQQPQNVAPRPERGVTKAAPAKQAPAPASSKAKVEDPKKKENEPE